MQVAALIILIYLTTNIIVTFVALSTLESKCFKILHLLFSEPKTFFYHKSTFIHVKNHILFCSYL